MFIKLQASLDEVQNLVHEIIVIIICRVKVETGNTYDKLLKPQQNNCKIIN